MRDHVRPLPSYLVSRFHGWQATTFAENKGWYRRLADEGQRPRAMVIACCDSRVHVTSIFGADSGEFFIHRNIANLVPPFNPDGDHHGTSAAVEYAVASLKVSQLIVMGHSHCGGIHGCHALCTGQAPELEEKTSFVGTWLSLLRPAYEAVKDVPEASQIVALEKQGVITSLANLLTFPFVKAAVEAGDLTLHGLWHDIGSGVLEQYLPAPDKFEPV